MKSKKPPKPPSKSEQIETITPEQWALQLTQTLTSEVFNVIGQEEKSYGVEFGNSARLSFLASIVASLVFNTLTSEIKAPAETDAATKEVTDRYHEMKKAVQDAVASGFTGGTKAWGGRDTMYSCYIEPEMEPINEMMC